MNVLHITGLQGAGKSQALLSIKERGWVTSRGSACEFHIVKVPPGHINNINTIFRNITKNVAGDRALAVALDIETSITPATIRKIEGWGRDAGLDQLFLAYGI